MTKNDLSNVDVAARELQYKGKKQPRKMRCDNSFKQLPMRENASETKKSDEDELERAVLELSEETEDTITSTGFTLDEENLEWFNLFSERNSKHRRTKPELLYAVIVAAENSDFVPKSGIKGTLSIRLDAKLDRALTRLADDRNIKRSTFINMVIDYFQSRRKVHWPSDG